MLCPSPAAVILGGAFKRNASALLPKVLAAAGPPVPVAEDAHGGGNKQDADDRRVHETATARPRPTALVMITLLKANAPVTMTMMAAADVMIPAVDASPLATLAVLESRFRRPP